MSHEIELCGCLTIPEDANFDEIYSMFPAYHKPMWYFGHFHGNKYTDDYVMLFDDIMELK